MNLQTFAALLAIAEKNLDQSATHDGMANCDILARARGELEYATAEEKRKEGANKTALEQCEAQARSIGKMVSALQCDFDRLEELREWRDSYVHSMDGPPELDTPEQWAVDCPNEAEELRELEAAAGDCESEDDAREAIENDPLSIEVRSGWASVGEEMAAEEFQILLCTGGPAVRIVGELDQYKEPCRAWLEYQNWFTPWTEYHGDTISHSDLLTYCRAFYFGE